MVPGVQAGLAGAASQPVAYKTSGGVPPTVTLNEQLATCPHKSSAVQVTVVTPTPKTLPPGGAQARFVVTHWPLLEGVG